MSFTIADVHTWKEKDMLIYFRDKSSAFHKCSPHKVVSKLAILAYKQKITW